MERTVRILISLIFIYFCSAEQQIVIIGSGLAGLSAAIEAAQAGAQVTVVEKETKLGGNSLRASSGMNAVNTPPQSQAHIQDSQGYFINDTLKSGQGLSNKKLVETLAEQSPEAWKFLTKHGVDLSVLSQTGGHSMARTHRAQEKEIAIAIGTDIIKSLLHTANQYTNITILTQTRVTKLVTDIHGVIAGVECLTQTGKIILHAQAVILATGGFCGHVMAGSLLEHYRPDLVHLSTTNGTCASGDGIELAQAIGARLVDMDKVQIHPTGFVDPKDPLKKQKFLAPESLRASGGILVNHEGKRFVNELDTRDKVTAAILNFCSPYQGAGPMTAYMLLNEAGAQLFQKRMLGFYVKLGLIQRFDNTQMLAKHMGVEPATLESTLASYTRSAINGRDEFGKTTFPITFDTHEPLYGMLITPCLHYCMGGVVFDEQARVIGSNGPIKNLYAAGEVTGGLHGANRLAGNSLLECVVFGRIAGQNASKSFLN